MCEIGAACDAIGNAPLVTSTAAIILSLFMRVPAGVIACGKNVEPMWPFPKFATQLIHVSERRYSVEGFRTAFLNDLGAA